VARRQASRAAAARLNAAPSTRIVDRPFHCPDIQARGLPRRAHDYCGERRRRNPNMKRLITASLLSLALAGTALAQVTVSDPWVRATVAAQKASGAFMKLTADKGARLVEARSPVAGVVEIHEMALENNVMKMRAIAGVDLPAGTPVEFKPGGYHVMLMELKGPLNVGDTVPITLVFEGSDKARQSVEVKASVRALTASGHGSMGRH